MSDLSLVAKVDSNREAWTGFGLAESIEGLVDAIREEGWVDDVIAAAALGLEVASAVLDPFSTLLSAGLAWAMEYFEPLRKILDELTGVPDIVASHAATWKKMSDEMAAIAADLNSQLQTDLPDWDGKAASAYQEMMSHNVEGIGGLAALAAGMSAATQAAGNLVATTRELVRDLIADLVAHIIIWIAESAAGVTIPAVALQITSSVVKWGNRIMTYVVSLLTTLQNLTQLMRG